MNVPRIEIFKTQDQENGYFDVNFEVEGKLIYAHKFMLAPISTTFKSMFSTNWNKEETIPITTYCYDDFFEFLTFIYSGKCDLNDANIFAMVNLAEFYQVKIFEKCCDAYLSKKEYTFENVLKFYNNLSKYFKFLPLFEKRIVSNFKQTFSQILKSETFITLPKEIVEKVVGFEDRFGTDELLFQKVYEWAENQVHIKMQQKKASDVDNFNVSDAIKAEITPFLPFIKFKEMNLAFLNKYVVKRGFLFSYDELSDILNGVNSYVKVKVTNLSGRSIYGFLPSNSEAINVIKSLKNRHYNNYGVDAVNWDTRCKIPSTPSLIKKRDGVEWYLIYYGSGSIGLLRQRYVDDSHYLLAEMNMEIPGLEPDSYCKIEIE